MILEKKVKGNSSTNVLNIMAIDGLCCGDSNCAITNKYAVSIDTSVLQTGTKISLGGTEYAFGIAANLTTKTGRDLFISHIGNAIEEAGYVNDGVTYTMDGNIMTIKTYWSQLVFDYVENSTYSFAKIDALPVGDLYNCKCCEASIIGMLVPPTCFSAAPHGADGSTIKVVSKTGKVLASWVSDGSSDDTLFNSSGAAAIALDSSGLEWSYSGGKLVICQPNCELDKIVQTNAAGDTTDIESFDYEGNFSVCFKVVACQAVKNVKINDGDTDVYDGPLATPGECDNYENVSVTKDIVCLAATALGYTGQKDFTVTTEMECGTVTETVTVNFQ